MNAVASGRPREFDIDEATDKAMHLFWARGYEGASITELSKAMGISKPSLYAAFGDKRGLFDAALKRYSAGPRAFADRAFELPTASEVVVALLKGVVEISTHTTGPKGCLCTQAALSSGLEAEEVRKALAENRRAGEERLRRRLEQAQTEGELPVATDVAALAKYVATVSQGITVQGSAGVSRQELECIVELAMQIWPAKGKS